MITIDNSTNIKGMSMTERQGGSDVQANTTTATPIGEGGPGQGYYLNGHKWFTSAPMSDAFLTLVRLFLLLLLFALLLLLLLFVFFFLPLLLLLCE